MYNIQSKKNFISCFLFLFFCFNLISYSEPMPVFEKRVFNYPLDLNIELVRKTMPSGKINYELIIKNVKLGEGFEHLNELRWAFLTESMDEAQAMAQNIIQKFFLFYKNFSQFKKILLLNGILNSETTLKKDENGVYLEEHNRKEYLTVEEAYSY